uniref:Beach domain-containing protein n=1 Tax=Tetraselmis sp. GSL018 TaxID=582737 RepID=A0A061R8P8_9CHLO
MFGRKRQTTRFSLLLLEEGEDYVKDWVAHCEWPSKVTGNWQGKEKLEGRLRLCSKSLMFDADDSRVPIVRLPFRSAQRLEGTGDRTFVIDCAVVVKMKQDCADAPYVFQKGEDVVWRFALAYDTMESFMPLAQEQLAVSRLPLEEAEKILKVLEQHREDAMEFDRSELVDFNERILYDAPATQMTPLVREAGRLLITDQRVYFQPLHNINGGARVRSHPLAHVAAVARRRSSLRPVGLELFFLDPDDTRMGNSIGGPTWDAPSAFFAFRTGEERERAVSILLRQPRIGQALSAGHDAMATAGSLLEADTRQLRLVTSAWQHGRISNMEYLLYCNLAAGRSFNDLTQWPVFPWVLSDYRSSRLNLDDPGVFRDLSKPVGALNPQRLELLRKRFREMPSGEGLPEPFLYGTHYSTPGYVMFWLVRAAPGHMLRLQNGRFDAPDRLFFDVAETWDSVAGKNHADVKELIPEFFLPDSSFLVNRHGLALGRRQNGRSVGDVLLPPWARDPDDFIAKHRAALESPTVSANLHKWIDLIFGYKQRGREAVEANNVFHPLTYEGAVDLDAVSDPMERRALEVQINEFGQTPRQLFTSPHPPRIRVPPTPNVNRLYQAQGRSAAGGGDCSRAFSLALLGPLIAVASSTGPPPDGPGPPGDASPSPPSRPSADGDGLPPPASTASASGASLRIRQLRTEGAGSSSSSSPARTPNGSRTPDSSRSEQRTTGSAESSPNRFLRSISASRIRAALGFRQSPREAAAGPGARQESPAPREEPPEPSQQQAEPPPSAGEGEGASAEARSPAPGCSSPASSAGSYATSPAGQRCRVIRAASGHVLQPEPALEPWGAAIRSRLRPLATIRAQKERINAVALSSCGGGTIYLLRRQRGLPQGPVDRVAVAAPGRAMRRHPAVVAGAPPGGLGPHHRGRRGGLRPPDAPRGLVRQPMLRLQRRLGEAARQLACARRRRLLHAARLQRPARRLPAADRLLGQHSEGVAPR